MEHKKRSLAKLVSLSIFISFIYYSFLLSLCQCICSCQPDTRPDVHPNCTAEEEKAISDQCASIIMSNKFKPCHSVIPPDAFLGNCIYDMCEYDGMESTLCDNVEAYAQTCQSAGVTISWRNNTFCREWTPRYLTKESLVLISLRIAVMINCDLLVFKNVMSCCYYFLESANQVM